MTGISSTKGTLQSTVIKSAAYCKKEKPPHHEFIWIMFENAAFPGVWNYMVLDRNKLGDETGTRGVAQDEFKISRDGSLNKLLKRCGLAPFRTIETITFNAGHSLQLYHFAAVAVATRDLHNRYHFIQANRYWFAGIVWEYMIRNCPSITHVVQEGTRGKSGMLFVHTTDGSELGEVRTRVQELLSEAMALDDTFDNHVTLNVSIPSGELFMPNLVGLGGDPEKEALATAAARRRAFEATLQHITSEARVHYLRDLADLGGEISANLIPDRQPRLNGSDASSMNTSSTPRSVPSMASWKGERDSVNTSDSSGSYGHFAEDRKYKSDKGRRIAIVREIVETEKSYVKGLQELLDIYVKPASELVPGLNISRETIIPATERKIVFTGIDALLQFHEQSFMPSLIRAADILSTAEPGEDVSIRVAHAIASVFVNHAAFMKIYFTYINNFDNAIQRTQLWNAPPSAPSTPGTSIPASNVASTIDVGLSMSPTSVASAAPSRVPHIPTLSTGQRRRIKQFLERCRSHPQHSQLNLEGYLLLPIQRIPRYKMLLDNLIGCTPPHPGAGDDSIERALEEIAVLANNLNEGKRESESRTKLVQWQSMISGKYPSPLVQPHRRLIMDGRLELVRLVKKVNVRVAVPNVDGSVNQVEVPHLATDPNPRQLVAILCNDMLVLCKEPPGAGTIELWAALRMQGIATPASIVSGKLLRLVDNKKILYFNTQSTSEALTWQQAINYHIPLSQ